jgi:hypothetical protein
VVKLIKSPWKTAKLPEIIGYSIMKNESVNVKAGFFRFAVRPFEKLHKGLIILSWIKEKIPFMNWKKKSAVMLKCGTNCWREWAKPFF